MEGKKDQPATIDEYIAQYPEDVQQRLQRMRAIIHQAAPEAEERISYAMPCFYQKGNLVYFAAAKGYTGFYPTGEGVEAFKDELSAYKGSKGSVHFPFDQPIPEDLVTRIVKHRVEQTTSKKKK